MPRCPATGSIVKLQTERVRLALAFSDGQRRDVKLDIAEERIHEIEQLASKGRIIGPGELDRLVDQTQPLVDEAADQKLNAEDTARLQEVATRSVRVLESVEAQVDPGAQEQLEEAKSVSATGVSVTSVVVRCHQRPPADRHHAAGAGAGAYPHAGPATEEPTEAVESPRRNRRPKLRRIQKRRLRRPIPTVHRTAWSSVMPHSWTLARSNSTR